MMAIMFRPRTWKKGFSGISALLKTLFLAKQEGRNCLALLTSMNVPGLSLLVYDFIISIRLVVFITLF